MLMPPVGKFRGRHVVVCCIGIAGSTFGPLMPDAKGSGHLLSICPKGRAALRNAMLHIQPMRAVPSDLSVLPSAALRTGSTGGTT